MKQFDRQAWSEYTDALIGFFTKDRVKSLAGMGLESNLPLFIVGMIRSGTTLTEQILSRHSQVCDGGEKTFWADHRVEVFKSEIRSFDSHAANRLGKEFLKILSASSLEAPFTTEKNPANVTLSAILHCVYPNAKLVHIQRHPVDNVLSMWMTPLTTGLPFVYDRSNIVFAYREYLRLVQHFNETLPDDRFRTFHYEDIVSSPEPTITAMLDYLELEVEENCFQPELNRRTVRTPSFFQVRQPINTESRSKWKSYEPWLGRFAELLAEG